MSFQFTHPQYLLLLLPALGWVGWLAWKSDVQTSNWRRWTALSLRVVIVIAVILAIAGFQWKKPQDGMNVYFVLDRSDSIPAAQQEGARRYVNEAAKARKKVDAGGVLVFGGDAAIETSPNRVVDVQKINAVVNTERTDIAGAIRLATAAFPEAGQRRIMLLSDGNENLNDALSAVMAARPLGVTVDVLPLGVERRNDVAVRKFSIPNRVKKGQTFEAKVIISADTKQKGVLRFYRNEEYMGEHEVDLDVGKNAFGLPQTLDDTGFYSYSVMVDAPNDQVPQNNRATSFITVQGLPRVLLVSDDPAKDKDLAAALRSGKWEVKVAGFNGVPSSLPEMQSYDAIFLSNISAGDIGEDTLKLLESAVRDFGVGLVCVGGDQTYAAGGYRGTPLETILPLSMELDSKKVMPRGALALIMHGMEFPGANQVARDTALAALNALGPQDEMGVLLWDGNERWLFQLESVGDKKQMGRQISGMNQGDLPSFNNLMNMAHMGLKASKANLKHVIVFSDGDPNPPSDAVMGAIVNDRITVSTVMIGGHVQPNTMIRMADQGKGRFYDVNLNSASKLPEIFIKEAAVILKSAIYEDPFRPRQAAGSELVRGINPSAYPALLGYVCTTPKARAEVPLISDKGDPVLAHWQFGLGRSVAFTSDARARWAKNWLAWNQYRQFWSQIAQWSLRRVENSDFTSEVNIDKGEGVLTVEAVDDKGNYQNFLNLESIIVSPKGDRQSIRLEQTAPGHYEARFPTREVGPYVLNLTEMRDGQPHGSQVLGASVNYSPELAVTEPNLNLLKQISDLGGGRTVNPLKFGDNPFVHDRVKTFQPVDLWDSLLKLAILLFLADVGVRRIQIDRDEWLKATQALRRMLFFWKSKPRTAPADESLSALLARRDQVRSHRPVAPTPLQPNPDLFKPAKSVEPITPAPAAEKPISVVSPTAAPTTGAAAAPVESTTSRLLAAKRKALKKD